MCMGYVGAMLQVSNGKFNDYVVYVHYHLN